MTAQWTPSLLETLSQKRDCCRALAKLSRQQPDLIAAGDLGALLELLAKKQRVMGRMDEVQRRLDRFNRGTSRWRDDLDRETQLRCHDVLEEMERLLAGLLATERQCEQELIRLREAAVEELRQADAGRQVNRAYAREGAGLTNRLIDLEAE